MRALELCPQRDPARHERLPTTPVAVFAHATSLSALGGADFYALYVLGRDVGATVANGDGRGDKTPAEQVQEVL